MPTDCFWLEWTHMRSVQLRVFTFGLQKDEQPHDDHHACSAKPVSDSGYQEGHDSWGPVVVDSEPSELVDDGDGIKHYSSRPNWPGDDPRWPTHCAQCRGSFPEGAYKQTFTHELYRRGDTGELMSLRQAPAGAMWDAFWGFRKGPDGICLMVKTPGGEWMVDGRASNCTMPDDNVHYCWIRHGDPRIPGQVTIDKDGPTCAAGAGSIRAGNYHGFLRQGRLVE